MERKFTWLNCTRKICAISTKKDVEKGILFSIITKAWRHRQILVLSRKLGEFLVLNDNIFISVFEGGAGGKVKIAIEAPEDVKIARSETYKGCGEVQKKLDAIRSRKIDSKARRIQNETERLARKAAPTK